MKKSISIVTLVVSSIVLAASCQCKCCNKEKPVAATKPVEIVNPKDQTDIYAIPLDNSEEEEQIEEKAIDQKVDEEIAEKAQEVKAKQAKAKEVKKTPEAKKDTPK